MAWQGIDVLQTGDRIVFRESLKDSDGAVLATGTTNLRLYELQNDGTLKSYDWNDNTFKTTALTTEDQAMSHRAGNNGGTNTGVWTYALTTLTGFTAGNLYIAKIVNTGASPPEIERVFQFGVSSALDPYDATNAGLSDLADVLADTNELQTDLTDGGRLDLLFDAIAGDVENIDGAAMRGTDSANTTTPPTAAAIRDAILDRVLAGNHDTAGTAGKLMQSITEARLAELDPANLPADLDSVKVIAEKLDDTLADNGGTYRFTAAALALAPGGEASVTVTVAATAVTATTLSTTGRLTITKDSVARWQHTDLGSLAGRTKLYFAIKRRKTDTDDQAIILIEETAGLVRVSGAAAGDSSKASLTVDDEDDGDVTVVIDPDITGTLTARGNLYYSYKIEPSDGREYELVDHRDPDVRADVVEGVIGTIS